MHCLKPSLKGGGEKNRTDQRLRCSLNVFVCVHSLRWLASAMENEPGFILEHSSPWLHKTKPLPTFSNCWCLGVGRKGKQNGKRVSSHMENKRCHKSRGKIWLTNLNFFKKNLNKHTKFVDFQWLKKKP